MLKTAKVPMVIGTGNIGILIFAARTKAAMPAATKTNCFTRSARPVCGKIASASVKDGVCVVMLNFLLFRSYDLAFVTNPSQGLICAFCGNRSAYHSSCAARSPANRPSNPASAQNHKSHGIHPVGKDDAPSGCSGPNQCGGKIYHPQRRHQCHRPHRAASDSAGCWQELGYGPKSTAPFHDTSRLQCGTGP